MTDTTIMTERCPSCAATAPYWRPDDRECEICLALAEMPDEIGEIVEALDNLPGILGADYGAVLRLRQIHGLLAEHVRGLAAEVEQLHGDAYAESVEKYAADMAEQARIKSMEIRGGTFDMDLEIAQEMTAAYVATARAMLGNAENYSETRVDFPKEKVELELKLAGELDRYVFTVQRAGKLTPHEARVKAEAKLVEMQDLLGSIYLYVKWRWLTKQLTTEQKEMWADAVDAWSERLRQAEGDEDPGLRVDRWWRDDFAEGGRG